MKRAIKSVPAILLIVAGAFGQSGNVSRTSVIWSAEPACSAGNTAEVKAANPACSSVDMGEAVFFIANFKGLSYAVTYRTTRDYVITSVQISNNSTEAVKITPSRSQLLRYKTESDFLTAGKSASSLSALSPDKLRMTTYVEQMSPESEGGIRPGLQVRPVYEKTTDKHGNVTSETIRLDPKQNPDESKPSRTSTQLLIPKAVFAYLLTPKSLEAGKKDAGHLVFKRVEEEGFFVFSLNVGGTDFMFPVGNAFARSALEKK